MFKAAVTAYFETARVLSRRGNPSLRGRQCPFVCHRNSPAERRFHMDGPRECLLRVPGSVPPTTPLIEVESGGIANWPGVAPASGYMRRRNAALRRFNGISLANAQSLRARDRLCTPTKIWCPERLIILFPKRVNNYLIMPILVPYSYDGG